MDLQQIAQEHFGYDGLRPGQAAAIQSVLDGHDTLAVMPTGSGKSAIYQMAAYLIAGPTVVVSPLVALQQDQVEAIAHQDVGEAAVVNSTIRAGDRDAAFTQLELGGLEFLFLAPEQFNNPETLERLQAAQPSLFVIDEAHCISEWGHDFRPDYLRLGAIIQALGHPRILALTATAAPPVREEILDRLGMQDPRVIVQGFDRPNLWLAVERFQSDDEKQQVLIQRVIQAEKPGIIYVATRKRAEAIATSFQEHNLLAACYHAGMTARDREQVQTDFMTDGVDVLVATTAFGMGVDKSNVRFVFHADISNSVDSYYQEIGRAGRDGETAKIILFYNESDLRIRRFFAGTGQVDAEQIEQVAEVVQNQPEPIAPQTLQEQVDLSKSKLRTALQHLDSVGVVETLPSGEVKVSDAAPDLSEAAAAAVQLQERRQQFERSRLEMMRGYAETRSCRREYLLNYFGEAFAAPCDRCDNCKAGLPPQSSGHQPYPIHTRVIHREWGEGLVMRYEGDKILILFNEVGYKTLGVEMALLRGLLQRVRR